MKIKYSHKFYERFLIFCSITSFFLLFISILANIPVEKIKFDIGNVRVLYLIIILLNIFYFIIFNFFVSSNITGSNIFRLGFFTLLFVTAISLIFSSYINILVFLIFSLFEFIFYNLYFIPFYFYSDFLHQCENKTGEKIAKDLFQNKFIGEDFLKNQKTTKFTIYIFMLIVLFFLGFLSFLDLKINLISYIFAFLFYLSSFLLTHVLSIYKNDVFYAFLGFDEQWEHREKILKFSFLFIFLVFCLSFCLSSNKAFFKFNFDEKIIVVNQPPKIQYSTSEEPDVFIEKDTFDFSQFDDDKEPNKFLIILSYIIETFLILLVVFGFFVFVTKPFVSGSFLEYMKKHKLSDYFREFIKNFRNMIFEFLHKKKNKSAYAKTDSKSFKNTLEEFLKSSKKSKEKKQELDRLTNLFVKIIDWGNSHSIFYKKNLAPLEYSKEISNYFKNIHNNDFAEKIILIGILFEKALYSNELLLEDEERKYNDYIKMIINLD